MMKDFAAKTLLVGLNSRPVLFVRMSSTVVCHMLDMPRNQQETFALKVFSVRFGVAERLKNRKQRYLIQKGETK
jgi:hypothetical protein